MNRESFQGINKLKKESQYFEGWYFKHSNNENSISFIPGINIDKNNKYCFIQVITNSSSHFIPYNINEFSFSSSPFYIKIGDNYFSKDKSSINIHYEDINVVGEILYKNITPCNNIMGPFSYIPFMECNHEVLSVYHKLSGKLVFNNTTMDFNNGIGYIEKDFGISFPKKYLWIQCNDFNIPHTGLMFSIASIPFRGLTFDGYICSFFLKGKEYRFTTYNTSRLKEILINEDTIHIELKKGNYILLISAKLLEGNSLIAPSLGKMNKKIKESINSIVEIELINKDKSIFKGTSYNAGVEIVK